ncbi:putative carbonic anhydrase [Danaus plexippus plexippus]|uniref:Carbonic anhydrase n=1 Tax=Danaus plexippus plexippus TaxID=278856 RepID=A0A212F719_DANPL|nr:putative carbonic anhydrase [Danaus plexippus plexippus]
MWMLFVPFLAAAAVCTAAEDWSYDYETKWPGVCTTGEKQSPINIMSRDAIVDKLGTHIKGPLVFRGYGSVNVSGANTGHTLKWTLEEDEPSPVVSGGPLRGNYSFVQFHLHWLSEHAIDGMKYPMEIHMVHMKTGLTAEEAVERPDGIVVIGILCQVHSGEESEFALGELQPSLPKLIERSVGAVPPTVLDLTRLFSPNMQSFYTYHGSITTPLCQEVVTWLVMDKPLIISDTQYKLFSKVDVGGIDNYRSLQANNRVIYRSLASSSSIALPSTIGLLASLFHLSSAMTMVFSKGVCTLVNIKKKFFGHEVKECKSD